MKLVTFQFSEDFFSRCKITLNSSVVHVGIGGKMIFEYFDFIGALVFLQHC